MKHFLLVLIVFCTGLSLYGQNLRSRVPANVNPKDVNAYGWNEVPNGHDTPRASAPAQKTILTADFKQRTMPPRPKRTGSKPMARPDTTLVDHVLLCADSLVYYQQATGIGYPNGTTRDIQLNNGKTVYIGQHGVILQVPAPTPIVEAARVKSVSLFLTDVCQVVGTPDSFYVHIYDVEFDSEGKQNHRWLGKQGFTLAEWADVIAAGELVEIVFNDTINVSGATMFALETRRPGSNDLISFFFTANGLRGPVTNGVCGPAWSIVLNESSTNALYTPMNDLITIGQLFGRTLFGNPAIFPTIEYYDPPTARQPRSVMVSHDDHIFACRDTMLFFTGGTPGIGFLNGTTTAFLQVGTSDTNLFIRDHGIIKMVEPPPAGIKARAAGMHIRFANDTTNSLTRIVGTADEFRIKVFAPGPLGPELVGSQPFRLSEFLPPLILDGTRAHYIAFKDTIEVNGPMIFALETRNSTSNDVLSFYFTTPGRFREVESSCGANWTIFLGDSLGRDLGGQDWVPSYNEFCGMVFPNPVAGNPFFFSNPYFVPVVEYYKPGIIVNAGPDQIIACGGNTTLRSTVAGAAGPLTYKWTPTNGIMGPSDQPTVVVNPRGTTTYTLTVSDGVSTATDEVTVSIRMTGIINAGANGSTICGNPYQLGSPPLANTTYKWEPAASLNNATISNPVATPSASTTYTLVAIQGTCSTQATVTVTVTPLTIAVTPAGTSNVFCGEPVQLNATCNNPNAKFKWAPGTTLSSDTIANPIARANALTTYQVTAYAGSCTSAAESTTVRVRQITVNAGPDAIIQEDKTATLQATPIYPFATYLWTPNTYLESPDKAITNITGTNLTSTQVIDYKVTASTVPGCTTATDVVKITIENVVGVSEKAQFGNLKVYPNPTEGKLYLHHANANTSLWVKVLDVRGTLILSQKVLGNGVDFIDLTSQAAGMYLVEVLDGDQRQVFKIQVK